MAGKTYATRTCALLMCAAVMGAVWVTLTDDTASAAGALSAADWTLTSVTAPSSDVTALTLLTQGGLATRVGVASVRCPDASWLDALLLIPGDHLGVDATDGIVEVRISAQVCAQRRTEHGPGPVAPASTSPSGRHQQRQPALAGR